MLIIKNIIRLFFQNSLLLCANILAKRHINIDFLGKVFTILLNNSKVQSTEVIKKVCLKENLTLSQREDMLDILLKNINSNNISPKIISICTNAIGGKIFYSQEGEDIFLERFFLNKDNGFFVDVGAHHPTRFSNTFALYKKGWRGLNIDGAPGSMDIFNKIRPEDINVERIVSAKKHPLVFSIFEEPALNTCDKELAQEYERLGNVKIKEIIETPSLLSDLLDQYVPEGKKIDLLSIDVEGEDFSVLQSNDWVKYCPEVIIIEKLNSSLSCLYNQPEVLLLLSKGFEPISVLYNSVIFKKVSD
jgi:hypothetical protein